MGLECYITLQDKSVELSDNIIKLFDEICSDFVFQNTVYFRGKINDFLIQKITQVFLYNSLDTNTLSNMYLKMNTFIQRPKHLINEEI